MVKNCVRNHSTSDEIDTETEICTSLKSEFYFRFRWTPSTKSTLIRYISVWVFVKIRGKICPPQSRNWKNWISHTSKIGNLLPVCLRNNRHLADQISEPYAKFLWKMVKNCVRNHSRSDEIDTETEICTSLKSEFYFRFRWPQSTKSKLISYISIQVFRTIREKICPPQSWNCQNWILHISKIGKLLPVCTRNNSVRNNHISERHAKFRENR